MNDMKMSRLGVKRRRVSSVVRDAISPHVVVESSLDNDVVDNDDDLSDALTVVDEEVEKQLPMNENGVSWRDEAIKYINNRCCEPFSLLSLCVWLEMKGYVCDHDAISDFLSECVSNGQLQKRSVCVRPNVKHKSHQVVWIAQDKVNNTNNNNNNDDSENPTTTQSTLSQQQQQHKGASQLMSSPHVPLDQLTPRARTQRNINKLWQQWEKLHAENLHEIDPRETRKLEDLVERWIDITQQVVVSLADKLDQPAQGTASKVDTVLKGFNIDPELVRYNADEDEFTY